MASEKDRPAPPQIRRMRSGDAPRLAEILRDSPEAVNWIAAETSTDTALAGTFILVSESPHEITGFLMARQAADEAEILNLAVRRSHRRTGVASALFLAALEQLRARKATRLFLEVRESNAPAIAFYQKHGFRQVGTRPGYYRQPDEAALVFERKLTG
jgi:ribosomal-protein-alanine N-acetyltransferase